MKSAAHPARTPLLPSAALLPVLLGVLFSSGCGGDGPASPAPPTGLPARITDLQAASATTESVTLSWTAPAPTTGTSPVAAYDLRYTPYGQEDADFTTWTPAPSQPDPAAPGIAQQATVAGLTPAAPYAFRLRATVDGATWSAPSNLVIASADPALDLTPPSDVADLTVLWSGGDRLMLQWTPAGDDGPHGSAAAYEIRSAPDPITPANWDAAAPAAATPIPGGGRLRCSIDAPATAGALYVALRAVDDTGNRSGLSNVVSTATTGGRTWRVAVDGSGDAPTIAAALESAVHGDLVLVGPGTYTWLDQGAMNPLAMIFIARDRTGIVLASEAGPEATILDAQGQHRVLFVQGNNDGVVIDGFTIANGVSPPADGDYPMAGGLVFHLTDIVVRNCIFTGNRGGQGGALYFGGLGYPVVEDCLFTGNTSTLFGGGLYFVNSQGPVVRRCTIVGNATGGGGGGVAAVSVILRLEDCVIAGNHAEQRGGGLAVYGYSNAEDPPVPVQATGCTIAGNDAPLGAAVRLGALDDGGGSVRAGRLSLDHCLIAGNTGGPAFDVVPDGRLDAACCDLYGDGAFAFWPAGTDISGDDLQADPLFCDPAGGDYRLRADSPCLDAGSCGLIGALGGCGR